MFCSDKIDMIILSSCIDVESVMFCSRLCYIFPNASESLFGAKPQSIVACPFLISTIQCVIAYFTPIIFTDDVLKIAPPA